MRPSIGVEEYRARQREYMRRMRADRHRAGLCVACLDPTPFWRCTACKRHERGTGAGTGAEAEP